MCLDLKGVSVYVCTIHWRTNNIFNSLISHETNFFIQPLCSLRTQKKLLHFNLIPVCFVNFWSFKMLSEKKDEIRFFKSNKRDKVNTKKYIIACADCKWNYILIHFARYLTSITTVPGWWGLQSRHFPISSFLSFRSHSSLLMKDLFARCYMF